MEPKEREAQATTNWSAVTKHINDLYAHRIKFRDPLGESEGRIKCFQTDWMQSRFGTSKQPDIAVMHQNYAQSETDLREPSRLATNSGHVSD